MKPGWAWWLGCQLSWTWRVFRLIFWGAVCFFFKCLTIWIIYPANGQLYRWLSHIFWLSLDFSAGHVEFLIAVLPMVILPLKFLGSSLVVALHDWSWLSPLRVLSLFNCIQTPVLCWTKFNYTLYFGLFKHLLVYSTILCIQAPFWCSCRGDLKMFKPRWFMFPFSTLWT